MELDLANSAMAMISPTRANGTTIINQPLVLLFFASSANQPRSRYINAVTMNKNDIDNGIAIAQCQPLAIGIAMARPITNGANINMLRLAKELR